MNSPVKPTGLLVIGYGNTLRGDDGLGPKVVESVAGLALPDVRTLIAQQLSPEHADPISQAETVIFVDASVEESDTVQFRSLAPRESCQLLAHAADPRTMLALARDVFGHAPQAWWLTVPARTLEFGESLSPAAQRGLEEAVKRIREFVKAGSGRAGTR